MKRLIQYYFVLFFACSSIFSTAQERKGRILNVKDEPVEFATIILLKDGEQAATAITDTLGNFVMSVKAGNYFMRVQNITYKPVETDIRLTENNAELGVIRMEDALVNMSEVVVTASNITREADRFVMQINNNMPILMNKDASEVLQLAPGVWVDDKGISINGTTGTKVYINDRELKLPANELVGYLRNYRSSDIARIEIVPQAGAEYSADSKGGIIRIILRKQQENGLSGNAMVQTTQGENYAYYKPSASINALVGKWTLNTSASGDIAPKNRNEMTELRSYPDGDGNSFQSESFMNRKPKSAMGRLGAVYEINNRNSIGAELEWWAKKTETPSFSNTTGKTDNVIYHSSSNYEQGEKDRNISATFNYIYKVDTLGSIIKTILDYTDKKVTGDNEYASVFEIPGGRLDSVFRNNSLSNYRIYTTDLMLDKRLQNGIKYTAGLRYTRNEMSNETLYEGQYNNQWKPLERFNYALDYTENISAAYATLAFQLGSLDILAGLRGEYTHTTGKDDLDKKYTDLFPNLNMTYSFNTMKTFLLVGQYARNIQRPNFWYLNSNRIQYSDYSYYIGNPMLRPTYINGLSLTAVYKYRHTLTVGANLHKDLICEVSKIDPENPEVKYIIPENHFSENHYFIAISSPQNFTKWFSLNTNLVGVKQDIRGVKKDKTMSHYLYFINATANFTLPAEFFFEVSYNGTSRLYSANSGIEPTHLFHAQIKKRLLDNRLNLTLGIHNIFNQQTSYFANMDNYTSKSKSMNAWNSRSVKLSLQYTFNSGKAFKKRAIEGGLNSEKGRIEKSSGVK